MNDPKAYVYREYGAKLSEESFIRNIILREGQEEHFIKKYQNKDIFYCIFKRCSPSKEDSLLYGEFYLDIDHKDASTDALAFESVREDCLKSIKFLQHIIKVPREKIKIYFSGNKGMHITVEPEDMGVDPSGDLNAIYKLLAVDINESTKHRLIDMQIYDQRRLFRMPNSRNAKTDLYKVRLSYEELSSLSLEEILVISKRNRRYKGEENYASNTSAKNNMAVYRNRALLSQRVTYKESTRTLNLKEAPPCIKSIMENAVKEGQRNNTSIAVASFFKQSGYNIEEAEGMLMNWAATRCDPPLSQSEIKLTLHQAYTRDYQYGCSKLIDLGDCDAKHCELKGYANGSRS